MEMCSRLAQPYGMSCTGRVAAAAMGFAGSIAASAHSNGAACAVTTSGEASGQSKGDGSAPPTRGASPKLPCAVHGLPKQLRVQQHQQQRLRLLQT